MSFLNSLRHSACLLTLSALLAQTTNAGLPLVCHPFATGGAELLPWARSNGKLTVDPGYDTRYLSADVARLLSPEAPTLARMENLRRASVYAAHDVQAANALMHDLLQRVKAAAPGSREAAMALFDSGYLVESYRQHGMTLEVDMLGQFDKAWPGLRQSVGALDGNRLVGRALAITHEPEMEFAASLMVHDRTSVR